MPSFNDERHCSLPPGYFRALSGADTVRPASPNAGQVSVTLQRWSSSDSDAPEEPPILKVKLEHTDHQPAASHASTLTPRPLSPPKYDVQHQATCFFLHLFSYQAKKLYGAPILDFLPDMLERSEQHTPIQHAAKAVSRMTLADQYSGQDVRLQTRAEYVKALNSVALTMSDQSEAMKDELLIAVWLLGLYEVLPR